jgi:Flp pilus assembly protein TadD
MKLILAFLLLSVVATRAFAAWYWPFGSDDEKKPPRMSELMEESSILIDEAFDLAAQGKISEAVEKYKQAYEELEKLEFQYPDRAATSEFSTVRNKKAYVSTSIDSLLLKQAGENARAVAVTDTTELEKKYEAEMKAKAAGQPAVDEDDETAEPKVAKKENTPPRNKKAEGVNEAAGAPERNAAAASARRVKIAKIAAENPANRKAKIMLAVEDLKNGEFDAAELTIKELLAEKPNDATALNLKAAVEAARGDYEKAKSTLHQLIQSNPKDCSGYYNLAKLIIKFEGAAGKAAARRYYDTARKYYGGPKDAKLEELLK